MKKQILSTVVLLQLIQFVEVCPINTTSKNVFQEVRGYYYQSSDSLKVKAINFIEDNVKIHYSFTYFWQDSLKNSVTFNELNYNDFNSSKIALNDSIKKYKLTPVSKYMTKI